MPPSIVRISALAAALALSAASRIAADTEPVLEKDRGPKLRRSIAALAVGYAWDYGSGQGIATTMRSMNFIGAGPFYYGMGSTSGWFFSTSEAFMETSLFAGWNGPVGRGAELDACIGLIPSGARLETRDGHCIFRAEAPAIQPSLGIGLPVSPNVDVSIFAAPVIRPYDLQSKAWDLSRSYLTVAAAIRIKQRQMVEAKPWNDG